MKVANVVAEILKREGIEFLIGYPVNPIIEAAAEADIRTIMVRQERIGLHMCDAIAKVTSGDRIGVFAMQHGPGTENAFGGVAQSLRRFLPGRRVAGRLCPQHQPGPPQLQRGAQFPPRHQMARAGDGARTPRSRRCAAPSRRSRTAGPAPVLVEFPSDLLREEMPDGLVIDYQKTPRLKSGPDPRSVSQIAAALVAAQRPVIVAGQGVHYGKAWKQLQQLAELLEAPVMTTLPRQERLSREPPVVAGLGRHRHLRSICTRSCRTPTSSSASAAASPAPALRRRCRRASASPMRRSTRPTSTRTCRSNSPRSAMPG